MLNSEETQTWGEKEKKKKKPIPNSVQQFSS